MTTGKVSSPTTPDLWQEEVSLFEQGIHNVGGVDEVGRGPLAGPVVASVVVASAPVAIPGVQDSKLCSVKNRLRLSKIIKEHPLLRFGLGYVEASEIDTLNILKASLLAFKRAVQDCPGPIDYLLVDGIHVNPEMDLNQKPLVKGDQKSFLIAAASIVAKVERDRIMIAMHEKWPVYGFNQHKGYPTKVHRAALQEHGICSIHRKSYAPVRHCMQMRVSGSV